MTIRTYLCIGILHQGEPNAEKVVNLCLMREKSQNVARDASEKWGNDVAKLNQSLLIKELGKLSAAILLSHEFS